MSKGRRGSVKGVRRGEYTRRKENFTRFDPFLHIVVGIHCLMKLCTKCKVTRPLREFYKDSSRIYGYNSLCNHCKSAYAYEWRRKKGMVVEGMFPKRRTVYNVG